MSSRGTRARIPGSIGYPVGFVETLRKQIIKFIRCGDGGKEIIGNYVYL